MVGSLLCFYHEILYVNFKVSANMLCEGGVHQSLKDG